MKFILIISFIIMFVPPVRRFVFQLLVGRQLMKDHKRQTSQQSQTRDGETRVQDGPKKGPDSTRRGGEYIDYEEIK